MSSRPSSFLLRLLTVLLVAALVAAACSGSEESAQDENPGSSTPDEPDVDDDASAVASPEAVESLTELLPDGTRGVFALTLGDLIAGDSADAVEAALGAGPSATLFAGVFAEIGLLTTSVDRAALSDTMLVDPGDRERGRFLLAASDETDAETLVQGLAEIAVDEATGWSTGVDEQGHSVAFSPDGWLVVGSGDAVRDVLASVAAGAAGDALSLAPYLPALDGLAAFRFAYGLPAFAGEVESDRSLRGAQVVTGALDIAGGEIGGEIAFHTDNAESFTAAYNQLDRHAIGAAADPEAPVAVAPGMDGSTGQVVVAVPASPLTAAGDDADETRNLFKKLLVGMDAHDYAEDVVDGGAPWFDLIVKSEADGDEPPSPASVFFRWEFKDDAAIEAFEANELPEGYTIAPTRFFESDDPEGQYFFLLNIYNAGGGSIVGGARAEWDVYVESPPGGPDPNPGDRPRFFVVDALAETVSFDPVNLVTPAEPLSHQVIDGIVTSSVARLEDGVPVTVWESTFPQVDPAVNEVTRFTPEMAIGNDYIYWGGGAADRLLYNATTYNHDAYLIDPADVSFVDNTRWGEYLKPELVDVVYYVNTLEYIVSPLTNLDSDQLDVTPAWREELIGFKRNGHQEGLMRKRVDELFRGVGDAMVGYHVTNETPSAFYHFEITDLDGFAAAVDLPDGHRLAPAAIFDGDDPGQYLTLSIFEIEGSTEGVRAEWSTTTETGDGRPKQVLLDLLTADLAIDPVDVFHLPDLVEHELDGERLRTRLDSAELAFEASVAGLGSTPRALSTDWVEAGDLVCRTNGVCDAIYYDAETLDVPVDVVSDIVIDVMQTPWDAFIAAEPIAVFARTNAQEYAAKRWLNLDVVVEELPFSGLPDRTHAIAGSGSLAGRDTEVVDSTYRYRGDAVLDGDQVIFALDQEVESGLGVGNIFTTGSFDLRTGTGTQTVVDCLGPALLCSDIIPGTTSIYTVDELDASDPDAITWRVDATIVLTGSFGTADSASAFEAIRSP